MLGSEGIYIGLEDRKAEGVGVPLATSALKMETVCFSETPKPRRKTSHFKRF
jgi:hypothetical protein